jgi:hypothetical protein
MTRCLLLGANVVVMVDLQCCMLVATASLEISFFCRLAQDMVEQKFSLDGVFNGLRITTKRIKSLTVASFNSLIQLV